MIGRSHGIHAEPITFGIKLAGHYAEFARNRARLEAARAEIAVCAISGPVGTFAQVDPSVEAYVAEKLGLAIEPVSTQVIPRDRHAAVFDQVWQRSATVYFASARDRLALWESLKGKYRAQAAAAKDDDELQRVLHRMIRERPPLREPATGHAAVSSAHPVATEAGLELMGFYHSHPDHPARPSQYDLDHAWPFFSYVIVSVHQAVPQDMTSWLLQDDRSAFSEETLTHGD